MDETPKPPRKRWPWLKTVLFVSLALNLLIVGLIAGTVAGNKPGDRNHLLRNSGYGPFIQALPRSDKVKITQALKRREAPFRENRAEFRREFEAFLALLRSQDLAEDDLRQVIERQRSRISERLTMGQDLLIERILAMTPEARASYADDLSKLFRRSQKKPPKRDD